MCIASHDFDEKKLNAIADQNLTKLSTKNHEQYIVHFALLFLRNSYENGFSVSNIQYIQHIKYVECVEHVMDMLNMPNVLNTENTGSTCCMNGIFEDLSNMSDVSDAR